MSAETIVMLGGLAGAVLSMWALTDRVKKAVQKIVKEELLNLHEWMEHQQTDIQTSKKEHKITFKAIRTLLKHLVSKGENGPIKAALSELDDFAEEQAHRGVSYENRRNAL